MKKRYLNACLLTSSVILFACSSGSSNSGNSNSPDTFVTMPLSSQVCASAQFFSPTSMTVDTNFGSSTYCAPYILQQTGESALSYQTVSDIVHYYYGSSSTLGETCPAIGEQSGVPFPESSPYSQNIEQVVESATACVTGVLNSSNVISQPMFVFDIDDTLTSGYIADCQNGFGSYIPANWTNAKLSNAFVRTPNMHKLLNYAFNNNISVAFVTGRPVSEYAVTESNMLAAYPEYESQIESIFASGNTRFVLPGEESWTIDTYKNHARQSFIDRGYTIILNMGDQYSDLNYIYQYPNQPYCSYKLPNYMYYIR